MIEFIESHRIQLIETLVLLVILLIIKLFSNKATGRFLRRFDVDIERNKISKKIINLFMIIGTVLALAGIWNIDQAQLIVFLTSMLTILGIAFVAQWSILSNITSSLILFFTHPLKIGEEIEVFDKDYAVSGKVEDISFFFIHIRDANGHLITIPNNVALQKTIVTKNSKLKK
ncbi:MAG: mechanosensitive ion channel domain-containing protein [Flavobacteriia bacterium]|jgi:small-conductance mechanosensitive channel